MPFIIISLAAWCEEKNTKVKSDSYRDGEEILLTKAYTDHIEATAVVLAEKREKNCRTENMNALNLFVQSHYDIDTDKDEHIKYYVIISKTKAPLFNFWIK